MATVYLQSHGCHVSSQDWFSDSSPAAFAVREPNATPYWVKLFQIILSLKILLIKVQQLSDAHE